MYTCMHASIFFYIYIKIDRYICICIHISRSTASGYLGRSRLCGERVAGQGCGGSL